jgi:diphosphomevalonate decarboxylase
LFGNQANIKGSSDLYGVEFRTKSTKISKLSRHYFVGGQRRKQVSSTLGHDLMHNHPYAERRFAQAHENLDTLISIFKSGNLDEFIKIVESEGFDLTCNDDLDAIFYFNETKYIGDY